MRIVFYAQHVLGIGHLVRSLSLAQALAPRPVHLVTGGAEVPLPLPENVRHTPMPGLMMDADFSRLLLVRNGAADPTSSEAEVARVQEERRAILARLMEEVRPDVFLVELYPFGRKRFGFELDPVLAAVREGAYGSCLPVCSVRDILVEKADQVRYETRVLKRLNRYFKGVLVHGDAAFLDFSETFTRASEIAPDLRHTGYVVPSAPRHEDGLALRQELGLAEGEPLLVASAGGGAVGVELLRASIAASLRLAKTLPHRLCLFTGPYLDEAAYRELTASAPAFVRVRRFTSRFPTYLAAADGSLSMAGYNTTMNLLAANLAGLVLPFAQNREQTMRATRLAERGLLRLLAPEDLDETVLRDRIQEMLAQPRPEPASARPSLQGARLSAEILTGWARLRG